MPKRILIAGAGYIANEFAGIFHEFGAKVTLINRTDVILRGYDEQIRDRLLQISMIKGIDFRFNAKFQGIEKQADGSLKVSMTNHDPIEVDCVMFATGRVPNTEDLGLEAAGVELNEKGAVKVDDDNRSNVPSIYAVGDVTNRVQLTPVAIREGQAFADTVFGNKPTRVDYHCIPAAVFSHPPMAGVGMTESEAKMKHGSVKVYTQRLPPDEERAGEPQRARALQDDLRRRDGQDSGHPHDRSRSRGNIAGRRGRGEGRPDQGRFRRDRRAASDDGGRARLDEVTGFRTASDCAQRAR